MNKKALITGGSSGIGEQFAYQLSALGYEVIIVGRNIEKLSIVKEQIDCTIISLDLEKPENCFALFEQYPSVDIFINNAGIGDSNYFLDSSLARDQQMINLNVNAMHILLKLYLGAMVKKNSGYILNVASIAGFFPGPVMSTYYATKAYVLSLTRSISYELKVNKSNVYLGALCPGTVTTSFWKDKKVKGKTPESVVKYALKKMFKRKRIIIPTLSMKIVHLSSKLFPINFIMRLVHKIQKKRIEDKL